MLEAQTKPKELISFRAGQLNMSHNGTTVVADKRRGKLSLVLSMEDGLLHLQWVQRPTGQLQESDDIMIPPRSAAFEKVPECKTGRVILLRFKQGGRKRFFWLQEPKGMSIVHRPSCLQSAALPHLVLTTYPHDV